MTLGHLSFVVNAYNRKRAPGQRPRGPRPTPLCQRRGNRSEAGASWGKKTNNAATALTLTITIAYLYDNTSKISLCENMYRFHEMRYMTWNPYFYDIVLNLYTFIATPQNFLRRILNNCGENPWLGFEIGYRSAPWCKKMKVKVIESEKLFSEKWGHGDRFAWAALSSWAVYGGTRWGITPSAARPNFTYALPPRRHLKKNLKTRDTALLHRIRIGWTVGWKSLQLFALLWPSLSTFPGPLCFPWIPTHAYCMKNLDSLGAGPVPGPPLYISLYPASFTNVVTVAYLDNETRVTRPQPSCFFR